VATLPTANPTLADWAKEVDPDGSTPLIVNLLSQTNEILLDATFMQGNLPTGHRVTVDTALPATSKRQINEGILPTKGSSAQFDEGFAMFQSRSEIDKKLVSLNANDSGYRMNQGRRFIESMNQDVVESLIYGNPATNPADFLGINPRYALSTGAGNSSNVFSALGTTAAEQTSILLVCWGPGSVFMGFPEGSNAGLEHTNIGEQTVFDVNGVAGSRMQAIVDLYDWTTGLVVEDWRSIVRIANIETSDLAGLTGTQAVGDTASGIIHLMQQALYRPANKTGRRAFYMNRATHSALSRIAMEKSVSALAIQTGLSQFGQPTQWLSFMGVPIRQTDAILNTEAVLAA
jgi:hypothetical protein